MAPAAIVETFEADALTVCATVVDWLAVSATIPAIVLAVACSSMAEDETVVTY
ncbi:hypothetical protein MKK70_26900 [Methylobacterium sp. E-041]|uniref:hypothetical protein n=1 Tax=Methylobacterium sp. E-041 TaxID=2836573 RepID=UPI001FB8FF5E|nr:hypothetical protein [Methylobacterium sp. E-041]MCJ2108935.1 hypothetical protein [Methylobacterium sp. E-041]